MPALPPYIMEPIFEQFLALLPDRVVHHPLGCHKPRIPDRVILEKLVQILVFGCAYRRIATEGCSATAIRDRRDEWIELGVMEALRQIALSAYDRFIGLELEDVAVDGCITKAPCGGGEKAGKSPVDRGKQGTKRSTAVDRKAAARGADRGDVAAAALFRDTLRPEHGQTDNRAERVPPEAHRPGPPAPSLGRQDVGPDTQDGPGSADQHSREADQHGRMMAPVCGPRPHPAGRPHGSDAFLVTPCAPQRLTRLT